MLEHVATRSPHSVPAAGTARTTLPTAIILAVGTLSVAVERGCALGFLPCSIGLDHPYVSPGILLGYLLIPGGTLALFGQNPLAYFGLGDWRSVAWLWIWFLVATVGISLWVAERPSFQVQYGLHASWTGTSLASTLLALTCGEFFYRGFLLLTVSPRWRWYAATAATIPYCLIHIGKPTVELLGSVPFALALSYLAIRSDSIVYGLVVHTVLAVLVPVLIQLSAT